MVTGYIQPILIWSVSFKAKMYDLSGIFRNFQFSWTLQKNWPANDWHVGAYSSIKSCVHEPCHCSCGHPTRTVSYTRTHSLLGSACCCLCLHLVLCEAAISRLQDQSILLRSMSGSITTLYNLMGFH